jgi:YbbR domain-containing protein
VEKIQKNVHINVKLQVPKGLTASIQKVRISADLEEYVEKKFELPVTCINLPDNIYVRFFPSTVEIVCYLSLTDYTSVKTEDLEVGVDYSELLQNTNVNIPPTMLRKPQWMDDYRIIPETLEYLIEQKQHL